MDVLVVGAGFTGTLVAVHLAREARPPFRVALIERAERHGVGVAYSTPHASHLLNVPACQMTAFPDEPDHFVRWARERDASIRDGDFLPRRFYGEYVRDVLAQALAKLPAGVSIELVRGEVVAVETDARRGVVARLADGRSIAATAGVLAIGNYPPADPPSRAAGFYASPRYRRDPWAPDALDVDPDADLLLLGTGLTMIDVALALGDARHRGTITCVSRRGLLPQSHRELAAAPVQLAAPKSIDAWPRTALGLLRGLRDEIRRRTAEGAEWREIVSSMRAVTPALWTELPQDERKRFLDHLRPYWETHRHRAAPAIGRRIQTMRDAGQLRLFAGRVTNYAERDGAVVATMRERGTGATREFVVRRVINCTGPDTDLARVQEPLVQQLRARGDIQADVLGLGLATDESGRLLRRDGSAHARLFLAGPLLRGRLWENTAVPELRSDAQRCARRVLEMLGRKP